MHYRTILYIGIVVIVLFGMTACTPRSFADEQAVDPRAEPLPLASSSVVPVSDNFNACELNSDLWTFRDPYTGTVAESDLLVRGYSVDITIPAGFDHDIDEMINEPYVRSPWLTQAIGNEDFTISVKFNSGIEEEGQIQGILAAQDETHFVAISLRHNKDGYQLISRQFSDGTELPELANVDLSTGTGPIYLQLDRQQETWTLEYAYDGISWSDEITFTSTLALGEIGVFGGNFGLQPPTHTLSVDYFYNTLDAIAPRDSVVMYVDDLLLGIDPFEQAGSVTTGPENPTPGNPGCGSPIRLTADAADGWVFDAWMVQGEERVEEPLIDEFGFGETIYAQFLLEPTPTPTRTSTPTATLTASPTATATVTGTVSATTTPPATVPPMLTGTPTATGTITPTPTATATSGPKTDRLFLPLFFTPQ